MKKYLFVLFFFITVLFHHIVIAAEKPLIYIRTADSTSLDPGKTTTMYNGEAVSNIFEGLVEYNVKLKKIVPLLAERWKMLDKGKRWRFILRKDVYFHDGSRLKASDVIYSFNIRNSRKDDKYPKWKIFHPYFSKIKRLSDFVIEIKLKRPFAPFLTSLSDPVSYIVKNGSVKKSGFIPIGTGPYKFSRWKKGKYIVLLKNNRYWKSEVKIKKIIFKVVRTPEIAINLLKSKQAHVIELKSIELRQQFTGLTGFRLKMSRPGGIFFMLFNTKKKYLNNKNFRKSFSHLINKKVLIKSIFQNLAHAAVTPIPPGFASFNRDIQDYEYNISKASKLMKLSGIGKDFKCRISYLQNDKTEYRIAEAFRKQAEKIGVRLIKDPLPFNELVIKLQNGNFDIALRGWVAGPDPDIYLFSNFSKVSGNSNYGKYFNTQLIDILTRARETMDKNSRINLYRKAQEIIHSKVPWIPLYYSRSSILSSEKIRNIYISANFFIIFRDAYIID